MSLTDVGNPVKKEGDSINASCAERLREISQSSSTVYKCLDLKTNKSVLFSLYKANAHYQIRWRSHWTIQIQSFNLTTEKHIFELSLTENRQ